MEATHLRRTTFHNISLFINNLGDHMCLCVRAFHIQTRSSAFGFVSTQYGLFKQLGIWASVKLGDTLGMLIWLETINGILCCFGGYTDK